MRPLVDSLRVRPQVALLDDDRMGDDPLGRVVVDIWNFFSKTTYDCWWPLRTLTGIEPAASPLPAGHAYNPTNTRNSVALLPNSRFPHPRDIVQYL